MVRDFLPQTYTAAMKQRGQPVDWHARQHEIQHLLQWIEQQVPEGQAIAGDFVVSTSVLAHTRRPIVLQPKYETADSRRRIETFFRIFLHGTPAELAAQLDAWKCRWLLVDRETLWAGRYIGGIPDSQFMPIEGTPAAYAISDDPQRLASLPGFELAYRSPPSGLGQFRVYRRVGGD
jgi:hypothetical protein